MIKQISLISLAMLSISATAKKPTIKYETLTDDITCGKVQYKIDSTCATPRITPPSPVELNECKPQTLSITQQGKTTKQTLPQLNTESLKKYKKAKESTKGLAAVSWECLPSNKGNILAITYFSGGNSELSEDMAFYDQHGQLMQPSKTNDKIIKKALTHRDEAKEKKIRSITN